MINRRRVSAFLILLLLLSTFLAASHHHENTADDHDCPICVVSHHLLATSHSFIAVDGVPCFTETTFVASAPAFTDNLFFFSLSTRGPPA
jgi:hypothetical protein